MIGGREDYEQAHQRNEERRTRNGQKRQIKQVRPASAKSTGSIPTVTIPSAGKTRPGLASTRDRGDEGGYVFPPLSPLIVAPEPPQELSSECSPRAGLRRFG